MLLGLVLIALFAASTYPVIYFGHHAADRVESMVYSEGHAWLEHHEHLAETWQWLYYATAIIAFAGFWIGLWKKKTLWITVPLVALLTLGSLTAGAVISEAGGRIRHDEFRVGPPPKHEDEDESDEDHDEQAAVQHMIPALADMVQFTPSAQTQHDLLFTVT